MYALAFSRSVFLCHRLPSFKLSVIMLVYYTFYKRGWGFYQRQESCFLFLLRTLLSPLKHKCTLCPTETAIQRLIYLSERALDSSLALCLTLAISCFFFFSHANPPFPSFLAWVGGYFQLDFIQFCQRQSTCSGAAVPGVCVAWTMSFAHTESFGRGQSVCLRDVSLFISDSFQRLTETNDSTQK